MTQKTKYYKHPRYGHVYGAEYDTPQGRFCWPHLAEPVEGMVGDDGKQRNPAYEVTMLFTKDDPAVVQMYRDLETQVHEMVALYNTGNPAPLAPPRILPDGDAFDLEKYPFYAGCWVVRFKRDSVTKGPVPICGRNGKPIEATDIVGGMEGRCKVLPILTARGVSYRLEIAQLLNDDGTRFGGGRRSVNELMALLAVDGEQQPTMGAYEAPQDSEQEVAQEEAAAPEVEVVETPPIVARSVPQQRAVNVAPKAAAVAAPKRFAAPAQAVPQNKPNVKPSLPLQPRAQVAAPVKPAMTALKAGVAAAKPAPKPVMTQQGKAALNKMI